MKVAILDMNAGHPNLGLQAIIDTVKKQEIAFDYEVFDVRTKAEIPNLDFDIYISSGGPGSPLDGDGHWDKKFFQFIQDVWDWNQQEGQVKKQVLFICHSFQMACRFFGVGTIKRRKSISFGIFPTHKTVAGQQEQLFKNLADPFYIADFRDWQVVKSDDSQLKAPQAEILTIEKERSHVKFERAIMSVRFSPEIIGVQFHPEAHPKGMLLHFSDEKRKAQVVENHGLKKYEQMIADMKDTNRLLKTHNEVIPGFLENAWRQNQLEVG
jgi:GMP synthase-like glutamine amidotransferase